MKLNRKQKVIWIILGLLTLYVLLVNSLTGAIVDIIILLIPAVILHKRFKSPLRAGAQNQSAPIPKGTPKLKKAFLLAKANSKDIIIALTLAIVAALAIEPAKGTIAGYILQNDEKAVATIIAYDKNSNPISYGSGFFIKSDGLLLTNYHVIAGSNYPLIQAKLPSGAFYQLKDVSRLDPKNDIAILQFDAKDVPTVSLGDSTKINSGDDVIAIGSSLGAFENSVSKGVISSPLRNLNGQDFIQFTAPISSGNSGGGLFKDGNVIGITSSSYVIPPDLQKETFSQNLNFAIPSNVIKQVENGQQPSMTEDSPDMYYARGSLADNKNNTDEAIADYQKAISIDDTYAAAYVGLGGDYYTKGQYDQELSNYQKAYSLDGKNVNTIWLLASAYEDVGQYNQAILYYEKALQIKPDDKDSMYSLGILYSIVGERNNLNALVPQLSKLDSGLGRELKILSQNLK